MLYHYSRLLFTDVEKLLSQDGFAVSINAINKARFTVTFISNFNLEVRCKCEIKRLDGCHDVTFSYSKENNNLQDLHPGYNDCDWSIYVRDVLSRYMYFKKESDSEYSSRYAVVIHDKLFEALGRSNITLDVGKCFVGIDSLFVSTRIDYNYLLDCPKKKGVLCIGFEGAILYLISDDSTSLKDSIIDVVSDDEEIIYLEHLYKMDNRSYDYFKTVISSLLCRCEKTLSAVDVVYFTEDEMFSNIISELYPSIKVKSVTYNQLDQGLPLLFKSTKEYLSNKWYEWHTL